MRVPRKRYLVAAFVLLLLLVRFVGEIGLDRSPAERFRVVDIIDGDTVELTGGDRLRLLAIDCPEKGEQFHDSAALFLKRLVLGKTVEVSYSGRRRDGYGRLLGYVYLDTLMLNAVLVRNGLGHLYLFDDNWSDQRRIRQLLAAQNEAMRAGVGIWSIPHDREPGYFARKGSWRFHRPGCVSIEKLGFDEVLKFDSRNEAFKQGYSPCRNCRP
ncbi:MAG: thermonuclease family protein [Candidatus Zixiibacteriota bacterium]|nr:MAG: thermonuclease family protein [candidate division Zixibacteria bacterium]